MERDEKSCGNRPKAISELIESIAKEESAIAHILDAEGKELEKALCLPDLTINDLIAINKSVTEVIFACTGFDHELIETLELFRRCLCFCREEDCDDHRHHEG